MNKDLEQTNYHYFVSYDKLGVVKHKDLIYVYMWVLGGTYYLENEIIQYHNGYSLFYKFTIKDNQVIKYENPESDSMYKESIEKLAHNSKAAKKILNHESKLNSNDEIRNYYSKITY